MYGEFGGGGGAEAPFTAKMSPLFGGKRLKGSNHARKGRIFPEGFLPDFL